jgi:hypothetical protein
MELPGLEYELRANLGDFVSHGGCGKMNNCRLGLFPSPWGERMKVRGIIFPLKCHLISQRGKYAINRTATIANSLVAVRQGGRFVPAHFVA